MNELKYKLKNSSIARDSVNRKVQIERRFSESGQAYGVHRFFFSRGPVQRGGM